MAESYPRPDQQLVLLRREQRKLIRLLPRYERRTGLIQALNDLMAEELMMTLPNEVSISTVRQPLINNQQTNLKRIQTMFNVDQFLQSTVAQPNSTEFLTLPNGFEGVAVISGELKGRSGETNGKPWTFIDVPMEFAGPEVEAHVKRPIFKTKYSLSLDMTAEGGLDMGPGMNVRLGRLRAAVRQNDPGRPWSPSMLLGMSVRAKIKTEMKEGRVYCEVGEVTAQ